MPVTTSLTRCATAALLVSLTATTGCALATRYAKAEFPDGDGWSLPLFAPLTSRSLVVMAKLRNDDAQRTVLMIVDSGAAYSTIPLKALKELGSTVVKSKRMRVIGASGKSSPWTGGLVDSVEVGDLTLQGVPFMAAEVHILGNDVLARHPWSVDIDRGVVRVGEQGWKPEQVLSLPRIKGRTHPVNVTIDGKDVRMILDTGAQYTSIDAVTGRALELPKIKLAKSKRMRGVYSGYNVHQVFQGHVRLGELDLGPTTIMPLLSMRHGGMFNQKTVGLLGLDLLRQRRFVIDADASTIGFSPRESVLDTVTARISRWSWIGACDGKPACIDVEVTHVAEGEFQLVLRTAEPYDLPQVYQFACVTPDGKATAEQPILSVLAATLTSSAVVRVGGLEAHLSPYATAVRAGVCEKLALVDVFPLAGDPPKTPEARLDEWLVQPM